MTVGGVCRFDLGLHGLAFPATRHVSIV
jgi:hypothetical protein